MGLPRVAPRFLASLKLDRKTEKLLHHVLLFILMDDSICVFLQLVLRFAILYTHVVAQNVIEIHMCLHLPILTLDGPGLIFSLQP